MLYDVTLLNLTHVVYSYPSTIKDLTLHEREVGCHFDPAAPLIGGGGQFIPDRLGFPALPAS